MSVAEWILAAFASVGALFGLVMYAGGRLSERQARRIDEATEAEEAAERAEETYQRYEGYASLTPGDGTPKALELVRFAPPTLEEARATAAAEHAAEQLSEREIAWAGGRQPMLDAMRTAKAKQRQALAESESDKPLLPAKEWSGFDLVAGADRSAEIVASRGQDGKFTIAEIVRRQEWE